MLVNLVRSSVVARLLGVPPQTAIAWARAMGPVYEELRGNPDGDVLDAYGATNPPEFFAVATETFFERPDQLRERHPELYAVLSRFYGLDLATPPRGPGSPSAEPRPSDGSSAGS